MTAPSMGAFLNYDVFADHYRGKTNLSGVFEAGIFTGAGAGRLASSPRPEAAGRT